MSLWLGVIALVVLVLYNEHDRRAEQRRLDAERRAFEARLARRAAAGQRPKPRPPRVWHA